MISTWFTSNHCISVSWANWRGRKYVLYWFNKSMVSCQKGPTHHAYADRADRAPLAGYPRINLSQYGIIVIKLFSGNMAHFIQWDYRQPAVTHCDKWCKLDNRKHRKYAPTASCHYMMTSSNGNIFRATGHLCGEFTGHQWIPCTKASDAELWCFPWSTPEWTVE